MDTYGPILLQKKAVQLITILASKEGGAINYMKAMKLTWLSDRLHLRRYGRTITNDQYFALPKGPVASTTLDLIVNEASLSEAETRYKNHYIGPVEDYAYTCVSEPDYKVLSETEWNCCEEVYEYYGQFDQYDLSEISHAFPEWKRYEANLSEELAARHHIVIEDFFENVADDSHLFEDEAEYLETAKTLYHNRQSMTTVFG